MNRLTLLVLASIPLAASTACALDTSEDVDDEKAVTNVAAADSIAGDSEIDGVDAADPVAAAKRFAEAPAKGCRTRTLDPSAPNVVHVALEGCSGRFDRHVLSGHLTVTFSANPDGTLHVASQSADLAIDGRPFTRTASSDLRVDGARRIVTRHVEQSGTRKTGAPVTQTKDVTVTVDTTTRCRDERGTARAAIEGRDAVTSTIELHACDAASGAEGCPTGTIEHDRGNGKKVTVTFDGTATATVSIEGGRRPKERSWTLACEPR